jgi:hypothetical protein
VRCSHRDVQQETNFQLGTEYLNLQVRPRKSRVGSYLVRGSRHSHARAAMRNGSGNLLISSNDECIGGDEAGSRSSTGGGCAWQAEESSHGPGSHPHFFPGQELPRRSIFLLQLWVIWGLIVPPLNMMPVSHRTSSSRCLMPSSGLSDWRR